VAPNGQEIAFRRDIDIYVSDAAMGETRRLTDAAPLNQMPSWSPNGKQMAFMSASAPATSPYS
jgi:Tol biopolymer transport system component